MGTPVSRMPAGNDRGPISSAFVAQHASGVEVSRVASNGAPSSMAPQPLSRSRNIQVISHTPPSLSQLLHALAEVQQEAGVPLRKQREFDTYQSVEEEKRDIPLLFPTLEEATEILRVYADNEFLIAEAARKVNGCSRMASECFQAWEKSLDTAIKRIVDVTRRGVSARDCCFSPAIQHALDALSTSLVLPKLSEERWKEVLGGLPPFTQAVLLRAPRVPSIAEYTDAYFVRRGLECAGMPSMKDALLLEWRGDSLETLALNTILPEGEEVSDHHVAFALTHLPHLKTLDLTRCTGLTSRCLALGHPTLERVILTGCFIHSSALDRRKFPKLVQIETASSSLNGPISQEGGEIAAPVSSAPYMGASTATSAPPPSVLRSFSALFPTADSAPPPPGALAQGYAILNSIRSPEERNQLVEDLGSSLFPPAKRSQRSQESAPRRRVEGPQDAHPSSRDFTSQ